MATERVIKRYDEIEGLCWVQNVNVRTGPNSSILLGGKVSTAVQRQPGHDTEYAIWGIHLATDDGLTFLQKNGDNKPIVVRCLDCRRGSPTLHNYFEVETYPDPSKCLIIPRGVAHLPTNVNGLVTINTPTLYWDWKTGIYTTLEIDVVNVEKNRPLDKFPTYDVCRWRIPSWLYPAILEVFQERFNPQYEAPFVFDRDGKLTVLRKKVQETSAEMM